MTCEQYVNLIRIHPYNLTRAERASVFKHIMECDKCADAGIEDMLDELPKKRREQLEYNDSFDPEYVEVIRDGICSLAPEYDE